MIDNKCLNDIFDVLPTASIILLPDAPGFTIIAANKKYLVLNDLSKEQFVGKSFFEAYPDHRYFKSQAWKSSLEEVLLKKIPDKILAKTDTASLVVEHIPVLNEQNEVKYILCSITKPLVDVTQKKFMDLECLEKKVLELNAKKDIAIAEVLYAYLQGIEKLFPEMQCSILQVKNGRLYNWAAPSLPRIYLNAIEGIPVGRCAGSCGTAVYLKQKVVVIDIENDLRWAKHQKIAVAANLRACWSYPIIDAEGEVMATFSIYYQTPKAPHEEELQTIARVTAILKIIIENSRNVLHLKEYTSLMEETQELAQFGNWIWDLPTNEVSWSDSLYNIFGLDSRKFKATFEAYLALLHPEDVHRVSVGIGSVLSTKQDVEFEERIIRPTGEIRYLKSWAKVILNGQGVVAKMVGASLDITASKKVQEALLVSEARLRNLVDAQTNYVVRIDFKGKFTYCNRKYTADFAWIYGDEDLIGKDALKTVLPCHYESLFNIAEKCIENANTVYQVELDEPQKGGGIKTTFWHFICLTDAKGEPVEMQCIGIDITDRKLVEGPFKINLERHKYINLATKDAVYDWDTVEDHIQWGESYCKMFGYAVYTEKYSIEKRMADVHPADISRIENSLKETLEDPAKCTWTVEYQFRRSDGHYANVEEIGSIIRNTEGIAQRMVGVIRDINDRKKQEVELTVFRKRYKDLFQLSLHPMWVYDRKSLKFLDVNDAAIKFYGYSKEEFLAMDITMIRPAEDVPELLAGSQDPRYKKGLVYHGIIRHLKKNGQIIFMDIESNRIEFNDQETYLVQANDVTLRLNYINAIEKQNQKFKELAWMQSHVVRAPLTRMMSLINLIKIHSCSDVEKEQMLEYLLSSANELDNIVKDISGKTEKAELNLGITQVIK